MKRHSRLLFAVIAIFLAVQTFSILHTAKYGFEPHKHNGHICEIFLLGEKGKYSDVPTPVTLPVLGVNNARPTHFKTVLFSKTTYQGAYVRAPPAFLLG